MASRLRSVHARSCSRRSYPLGFSKTKESVEKCLDLYVHYARNARKLRADGICGWTWRISRPGRIDGYIEQGISIWDIAAGKVLIEEAGGQDRVDGTPGA